MLVPHGFNGTNASPEFAQRDCVGAVNFRVWNYGFVLPSLTASMWVDLLPRQRDCRADAVALGAWERWHRRQTVTERALRKQTLRTSSLCELVEFARSATAVPTLSHSARRTSVFVVRDIALRGRRHGGAAQAACPLRRRSRAVRVPLAITSVLLSSPERLRQRSFTPLTYSAVLVGEQQVSRGLDLNRFSAN